MKSKIKPEINTYYLTVIDDMLTVLENSTPGKRRWTLDEVTGLPDYGLTERSTFPDWSKFFYEKTPKNQRIHYRQVDGPKPYHDGYFNGNTKEFKRTLENSKSGYLSKSDRLREAWEIAVHGFLDEMRYGEEQYGESYYSEDFPF